MIERDDAEDRPVTVMVTPPAVDVRLGTTLEITGAL